VTYRIAYRIASVLLVLFALGHQLGFQQADPQWHADPAVSAMKNLQFTVQGFNRSYWQFFSGFGYMMTVFLLFCAVLAWQLGGLPKMPVISWTFALAFITIAFLSWRYFFYVPLGFSAAVALCNIVAASTR